jgi:hypothetical protein
MLEAHAHQNFGSNAALAKIMRYLVGTPIQFSVAHLPPFEDDSHRIRVARYLLLEQFVNTGIRVFRASVIPLVQNSEALTLVENRYIHDALSWNVSVA